MYKREILIVEDDKIFAETLEDFLKEEGFEITLAHDAKEAIEKKYYNRYDLCIFDINIPYQSGIELFSDLRKSGDFTPTIFVTSYKDTKTLQECFERGACDYIKKPIDLYELLSRIKNIFRYMSPQGEKIILNHNCYYDSISRVMYVDKKVEKIPKKVMLLLELLVSNINKIVTKDQIVDHLWSANDNFSEGSIRVYINHLNRYLQKDMLVNIKGVGYKLLPLHILEQ